MIFCIFRSKISCLDYEFNEVFLISTVNFYFADDCDAGHWCKSGSASATPIDGVTGMECPEGRYCPKGIPVPEKCPIGTWSNSTGLATIDECQACIGGYYCDSLGQTEPTGPCDERYYCSGNATTPTPNDGGITGAPCTVNHYCPEGTAEPIPCEDGTYTDTTQNAACWPCTAGYYCVGMPQLCPPGYYCPEGTGLVWESCPPGTFSQDVGLANSSQCTQCLGGYYCSQPNATTVTGKLLHCHSYDITFQIMFGK